MEKVQSMDADKIVEEIKGDLKQELQKVKKEMFEEVNDTELEIYAEIDNVKENMDRKLKRKNKTINILQEDVDELSTIINKELNGSENVNKLYQTIDETKRIKKKLQILDKNINKLHQTIDETERIKNDVNQLHNNFQHLSQNVSKMMINIEMMNQKLSEINQMYQINTKVKQKLNELQEMLQDNSSWNKINEINHLMPLNGRKRVNNILNDRCTKKRKFV